MIVFIYSQPKKNNALLILRLHQLLNKTETKVIQKKKNLIITEPGQRKHNVHGKHLPVTSLYGSE